MGKWRLSRRNQSNDGLKTRCASPGVGLRYVQVLGQPDTYIQCKSNYFLCKMCYYFLIIYEVIQHNFECYRDICISYQFYLAIFHNSITCARKTSI